MQAEAERSTERLEQLYGALEGRVRGLYVSHPFLFWLIVLFFSKGLIAEVETMISDEDGSSGLSVGNTVYMI